MEFEASVCMFMPPADVLRLHGLGARENTAKMAVPQLLTELYGYQNHPVYKYGKRKNTQLTFWEIPYVHSFNSSVRCCLRCSICCYCGAGAANSRDSLRSRRRLIVFPADSSNILETNDRQQISFVSRN